MDNNPSKRKRPAARRGAASQPQMPDGLGDRGRREWSRICRELDEQGRLAAVDETLIADHCLVCERIEQAEASISEHGLLVPGERGMVKNPAVQMSRDYRDRMHRGLQLLGLDPGRRDTKPAALAADPEGLLD